MKILEVTTSLNRGGVDKIIAEYIFRLGSDFSVDFMHSDLPGGMIEQDVVKRGYHVYRIPKIRDGIFKYIIAVKNIIKNGNYDIVHINTGYKGVIVAKIAKLYKIPIVICHSHFAFIPESFFAKTIRLFLSFLCKLYSNCLMACGEDAAKWMWGAKAFSSNEVYILRNAIDTKLFRFSPLAREKQRKLLKINDEVTIGNVARFVDQKNHSFLLDVFYEYHKINPKSILLLIGDGYLKKKLEDKIKNLNLKDSVIFLGTKSNVYELLNAMDVFVLPSKYEGLPIVLVEAQANGLPSIASDSITREVGILESTTFIQLDAGAVKWANEISKTISNRKRDAVVCLGAYDIDIESKKFELFLRRRFEEICNSE